MPNLQLASLVIAVMLFALIIAACTNSSPHMDNLGSTPAAETVIAQPEKPSLRETELQLGSFDPIQHLALFIFSREMATTHVFGLANEEGDEVYFPSGRKAIPTKRNTSLWFAEKFGDGVWIVETDREIYRVYEYQKTPIRLWP